MSRFEWMASESAPKGYPMQILQGSFYDSDGGGLYIPSGKKMHDGWGVEVSRHIVGEDTKRLPNRFDILYFSYTENTFYQGEFNLPETEIYELFNKGYYSPKLGEQVTYDMIIVGVAPGGLVSVWLQGVNRRTEVFSGQANPVDVPWEAVLKSKKYTREEYVKKILEREISAEAINAIKQNGISQDRWDSYRTRYHWKPVVSGIPMPAVIDNVSFLNGEKDYFSPKYGNDWADSPKAVPGSLYFIWKYGEDTPVSVKAIFNEAEISSAFQSISEKTGQPIFFDVHIVQNHGEVSYGTVLRSGDEAIELEKNHYEQYQASLIGKRLEKFLEDN